MVLVPLLLATAGIALLYVGGEGLVRGSTDLARRAGLTPLVVGVTVVAFGTSAPELVVSVLASAAGEGDVAMGNVLGSNIFNIGIVLGAAALVRSLSIRVRVIRREALYLPLTIAFFLLLAFDGQFSLLDGVALLAGISLIVRQTYVDGKREAREHPEEEAEYATFTDVSRYLPILVRVIGGLLLLVAGARALVEGAVGLADAAGVPPRITALTIVAGGTSMPELVTSVLAARAGQHDIAVGNVIGSNLFNLIGIIGASALAAPLAFHGAFFADFAVMTAFTVVLIVFARTDYVITRREGAALVIGYVAYLAWLLR